MNSRLRDWSRFSIRHQVLLLFFVVIVLPFVFIGYFAYTKSVEAIENVSSVVSLDMIDKNGKTLDNYLNLVGSAQNELMFSSEIQELLSQEPKTKVEEMEFALRLIQLTNSLSSNPHAYSIRLFPIEPSRFPTFTESIYNGIDIENEPWFRQAKETRSPFWQLFLPRDTPTIPAEPVISKIKRLYSLGQADIRGIVAADIKVSTLGDYLAPVKMLPNQQVMLLDENGAIAYHQDASRLGTRVKSSNLTRLLAGSVRGSETIELEGVKHMVTFTTLGSNGWKLVSLVPLSVLTQPVSGIERISVLFLLFYFLISVFTVVYITVRFTNPIQRLVRSMSKVERGDFPSPGLPQARRQDEIGWLYRGFDTMVRRIDRLVQNAEKAAKDKKELEFQVLTHQINPHFLYNTLEAIRWKAESRGADDISEMVSSLGNLLRLSLNDGKELTTVEREIEHVRQYVNIEIARQAVPIRVVYGVDADIAGLPFLRLLIQPLVENAIKHGIRSRTDGSGIKIVIRGEWKDGMVRFEISDNGPGIPEPVRARLLSPGAPDSGERSGVGLRNVHARLNLYFGEPYGLRIPERDGAGATIELLHPVLATEPNRTE
ncbi:cache domain-containing sensor histidine kinase [Paenibacillus flagellatus]|uniref:Sensor histidine kinase n=1 Tax=Paenibacillus flagellatus TaxID=2211139 RepID=A0A2V5KS48_9BACL|nr:sensor histidine kinase [Paenibacillus flagellatus]PYI54377.1 sensor histidine kinase [Paenibacillus flagellatus]